MIFMPIRPPLCHYLFTIDIVLPGTIDNSVLSLIISVLSFKGIHNSICNLRFFSMYSLLQWWMSMTLHSSSSLFSDKVDNTDGLNQLQMDAFGCMVQGSFLTHMYSVGRHSRRSSSSRKRTGKPYAAHLARLDYLLIYLPTQVQLTVTKIIKIVATRRLIFRLKCIKFDFGWGRAPDPAWGAYSAPPDPLAGFGGP